MPADTSLVEPVRNETTQGRWISYFSTALVTGVFVVLGVRLFKLISDYAVNIFFSDQWDFNDATLFQRHSIWQIFRWQVGPHRQGVGGLFEKLIEPHFRWNTRIESFIVGGIVVAAALCALWLKKRLYGRFSVSDVLIPAVFFIPGQFETLFVTANFAHGPFPLLLMMLYCLAWTCSDNRIRYGLVLIINVVTIYTGFGLLLGFITPILFVLDYYASLPQSRLPRPYFVGAVTASVLSLVSFFIGYTLDAGLPCFSLQPFGPRYYVAYIALMFANFFGFRQASAFQELLVGTTALIVLWASLGLSAWRLVRAQKLNLPNIGVKRLVIVLCLIGYCLLFCLMTAYGRLCSGVATAYASRYVIYLELGVLGLYFYLLNIPGSVIRRLSLGGLLAVVLAGSWYVDREDMGYFPSVKQRWKSCYLQIENVDRCDQAVGVSVYPPRRHLQEKLEYLKKNRLNLYAEGK
jgi:hypothetical protein